MLCGFGTGEVIAADEAGAAEGLEVLKLPTTTSAATPKAMIGIRMRRVVFLGCGMGADRGSEGRSSAGHNHGFRRLPAAKWEKRRNQNGRAMVGGDCPDNFIHPQSIRTQSVQNSIPQRLGNSEKWCYPTTMTTMQSGGFGSYPNDQYVVEQRTSVMAILSLVLGIICIPGFGIIGAILGIAALFSISGSGGRVGGRGLAIGGIILGVLASVLWLAAGVGVNQVAGMANKGMVAPMDTTMKAIESGDFATAKKLLVSPTLENIKDSDFEAFRAAYRAELGEYQAVPTGLWEYLSDMGQMGPVTNQMQQAGNLIPLPLTFAKEKGIAGIQVATGKTSAPSGSIIPIVNIQVFTRSGKVITLYDPSNRPLPSAVPGEVATPVSTPTGTRATPVDPVNPPAPPVPPTDAPKK